MKVLIIKRKISLIPQKSLFSRHPNLWPAFLVGNLNPRQTSQIGHKKYVDKGEGRSVTLGIPLNVYLGPRK